jgi:uncharacterized SAM-binding protein YcdF (DUF218 family)
MANHPYMLKVAVLFGLILSNYYAIPNHNTNLTHFDTLIVLGTPSLADGTPSPEQRERVLEGIREYRAGVAPRLIMTGGAAHNNFVEAHSMKLFAISQGVPADVIIEEGQAQDTIQNIYFSNEIMQQHNWRSAEIVSSPSHLPRTALIVMHYKFAWRTHPAQWPHEYAEDKIANTFWGEMKGCYTLVTKGFKTNKWLPGS